MRRLRFAVVTLLLQLAVCEDYFWLHNSNWDEPNNWSLGRVPCGGQNVSFAAAPPNSLIYVKSNVTVRRILLPTNGKIILKPSVTIRFSEQSSCAVENSPPMAVDVQNEFIGASRRHDWVCAENWVRSGNRPAYHPPCGRDNAIFKQDSAYSFVTSNRSITVSSLSVRGVQLQSLSNLTDPRSEFMLNVTINKECARNPSLCPCPSQAGCRDACTRGIDDCHPNATCFPETSGWYYCRCNHGFEGDGRQNCTDSCDPSLRRCGPNSTCMHRNDGYYECRCDPGFIGNGDTGCVAGDKPVFLFRGTTYQNNSLVTLENLGEGDDALHCITNDTDCCVKAFIREGGVEVYGNWYYPNHTRVPSVGSEWDFFRTRGESVVNLHRRRGGDIGIYRCQLPYVTNDTAYLYIGVYTATTGSPVVTSLTYNNRSRTLNCTSTGGPATNVTWRRHRVVITLNATHQQTKTLVDPVTGTYQTVLTIDSSVGLSGLVGNYNCTVENIRGTSSRSVFVDSCDPSFRHCGPNSTCVYSSDGHSECSCDPGFIGNGDTGCVAEDKPVFLFRGTTYRNNSLVTLEDLGGGDDALHCITNDTDCCRHPFIKEFERSAYGNWFYPNDTRVQSEDVQWDFYRDRSLSIVHMFRRRGGDIGIYRCQLPYVTNDTAYLYIGVYTETTGSPNVTSLTYNNRSRTLTCTSTGGPATTVTWRKNGVVIMLSATHQQTKNLVNPVNGTYRMVLTIDSSVGPSGLVGNYSCTVENTRGMSSRSVFVDACAYGLDNCHPNATCFPETSGWYYCRCNHGFEGDGRNCTDSCDPSFHRCGPNSTCMHRSDGYYECPCDPGFIGNGGTGCVAGDKPVFLFKGTTYQNNSLVTLEHLGEGGDALHCITNDTDCCVKAFIREGGVEVYGNWYYPNHTRVPSSGIEWDFFRNRYLSVVNLHRRRGGDMGIYRCQLPYVTNDTAYLYIGVYTATTGSPVVTSLTYNNRSRTLTCTSTGGPATTVTWRRNGVVITLNATHQQTKTLVDSVNGTYQTVLTIDSSVGASGLVGNYNCTVENIRGTSSRSVFVGSPSVTSLTYNNRSRTLTCTSTGGPATTVTWRRNGAVITLNATYQQTKTLVHPVNGTYQTVLTIDSSVGPSGLVGNYSCTVGVSSKSVVVTGSPSVTSLTYNNRSRTLTCTSTGGPATTVTWRRNGVVITLNATHQQTKNLVNPIKGTYQTVLTIDSSVGASGLVGNYSCTVGVSSKSIVVTVPVVPEPTSASNVGGVAAGVGVVFLVLIIAVIVIIVGIIIYRRRKRASYTKDDLLDPGDDMADKPDKPNKSSEGVSFENPLYVGSNEEDMLELIGTEITCEVEPDDTEDHI